MNVHKDVSIRFCDDDSEVDTLHVPEDTLDLIEYCSNRGDTSGTLVSSLVPALYWRIKHHDADRDDNVCVDIEV